MKNRQIQEAMQRQFSPLVFDGRRQAQVLSVIRGETRARRKVPLAFALTAALVLALGATAWAALGGDVLSYLWGSTPTAEQQGSVQIVGVSDESDGVRVTLTDCLYDGLRLSGGLLFESEEPVFVWDIALQSPMGLIWMDFASPMQGWNVNPMTGVPGAWDNTDHGFLAYLDEETAKKAAVLDTLPVTVTITCMKPAKGLMGVDEIPGDGTPEHGVWQKQVDMLFEEGYTVVYASETGHGQLYPSWCGDGVALEDFPAHANLVKMEPITLEFEVDTRRAAAGVKDITPQNEIQRGPYTFRFHEVLLTPLTTWFHFAVAPSSPQSTSEEWEEQTQWFEFYDENRQPLQYQLGEYFGGGGFEEQEDGSLALGIDYPMPALAAVPEGIYVVPRNHQADGPLWEYAVYLPVK